MCARKPPASTIVAGQPISVCTRAGAVPGGTRLPGAGSPSGTRASHRVQEHRVTADGGRQAHGGAGGGGEFGQRPAGDRAESTLGRHLCTQFQQAGPEAVTDTLAPARCHDMKIAYK
jgi:hypothetical protein